MLRNRVTRETRLLTVLLHDAQELDDDLRTGPDHDLPLARLFGIVDALEGVIEDACSNHLEGGCLDEDGNDDDRRSGFEILKPVGMRYLHRDRCLSASELLDQKSALPSSQRGFFSPFHHRLRRSWEPLSICQSEDDEQLWEDAGYSAMRPVLSIRTSWSMKGVVRG